MANVVCTGRCCCSRVGVDSVIASDVRTSRRLLESGPFSYCDVLDKDNMARIILENGCTHVVHLATLLSGELELTGSRATRWWLRSAGHYRPRHATSGRGRHGWCVRAESRMLQGL
jgi:hypothetical protein